MPPNLIKYFSKLQYLNTIKHHRRVFCSKTEDSADNKKNDEESAKVDESTDEFIESEIPKPKYVNVNQTKNIADHFRDEVKHTWSLLKYSQSTIDERCKTPYHYDFVIFGGGAIGTTLAHHLKSRVRNDIAICVIDSDFSPEKYSKTDPAYIIAPQLTTGHLTQQFSLRENILLAKRSLEFFRNIEFHLNIFDGDPPTVTYRPFSHLTLATNKGHVMLKENHIQQMKYGVHSELATSYQLSQRFPWLNVDDISLASFGTLCEGWIDPWEYMLAVRTAARRRGVFFIEATPLEIHFKETDLQLAGYEPGTYLNPSSVVIEYHDGQLREIDFGIAIVALGPHTGQFMRDLFHLKKENKKMFKLEVPITRKKHYVFCFESDGLGPGLSSPMINDPSGVYFRRDGLSNMYVCGCTLPMKDPSENNLKVDPDIFYDYVWPILYNRVPGFEKLQLKSSWAYFEDHNSFDGSPIIGFHPAYSNVLMVAGFGRHSISQAPGVAIGVGEHLLQGYFNTIDLTRLNFNRIIQQESLVEPLII